MNSNGQADIGYWQMIEMQKDPVAWMYRIKDTDNRWELTWNKPMTEELFDTEPLYTHPVKELTDEEIFKTALEQYGHSVGLYGNHIGFARAILRKAQEK
jgi:poly(3-hydroxyalkanoate) synthetase